MHYLVENKEQFSKLQAVDTAYIKIIAGNDYCHPSLESPTLVYYNPGNKGYVLCVKHHETFSLSFDLIKNFLMAHNKLYVLDKKYHTYFFDHKNLIDVNHSVLDEKNSLENIDHHTKLHNDFYNKYYEDYSVNEIIPVSKHYEYCENEYDSVKQYFGKERNTDFINKLTSAYKYVEESGVGVDIDCASKTYQIKCLHHSSIGSKLLTYYNLYNLTGRPTNSFNGINFLAIPKEGEYRKCFVADNYFVEFDFDAYHPRLIAKLIDYQFPKEEHSVHSYLAKSYFGKSEVSQEEYAESKGITFKQLYGGVQKKYEKIPFFAKTSEYVACIYQKYTNDRQFELPTGRIVKYYEDMTPMKLFNYIIQNLETKENVDKILELREFLVGTNTKLVMITYDSFLFDFDPNDGKDTLVGIKEILEKGDMKVKYKYGETYSFYENK